MSLSEQQTNSLLNLVGLSQSQSENQDENTDLLDRLVRKIHMDILLQKDEYRAQQRPTWPRVVYGAKEITALIGKPYLTVKETNQVISRLQKLHISTICPLSNELIATMRVKQQIIPAPKQRGKRRHRRN